MPSLAVETSTLLKSAEELIGIRNRIYQLRDNAMKSCAVLPPGNDCVSELVASSLPDHIRKCHRRLTEIANLFNEYAFKLTNSAEAYAAAETDNAKGLNCAS